MSESGDEGLANGPESAYVVTSIDAILHGDLIVARMALIEAAEHVGWPAVAHRLDVVGRALTADAGMTEDTVPDEIDLEPELVASTIAASERGVHELLARWCHGIEESGDLPVDEVWPSLALVAWLVDRAGYPAEVVV